MPLVRVDLRAGRTVAYRKAVGDVVYDAMVEVLGVPKNDRFQVICEHPGEGLVIDPSYLGVERTEDCVVIQVFLNQGREVDTKRAFYRAVVNGLHERVGVRVGDVFINLVEVPKENWSFGNGEAQYAGRGLDDEG